MRPSLQDLAAAVRKVWNPPAGRAWSHGDLAIVKLLKAVEEHECTAPSAPKVDNSPPRDGESRTGERR